MSSLRAAAFLAVTSFACAQPTILMIGDSSGSYAGQSLAAYCDGATVMNRAEGGTTAAQWTSSKITEAISGCSTFTHVWIGIGGNDLFAASCTMTQTTVESRIQTMINDLKAKMAAVGYGANDYKIFATGYCVPASNDECPDDATLLSGIATLQGAWAQIATQNSEVTFFDSALACAAPDMNTFSPSTHHVDSIHFNDKGYCSTWTNSAIQTYLGCGQPTSPYSCDSIPSPYSVTPPLPAHPPAEPPPPLGMLIRRQPVAHPRPARSLPHQPCCPAA